MSRLLMPIAAFGLALGLLGGCSQEADEEADAVPPAAEDEAGAPAVQDLSGATFFAENGKQEGVVTLPSGLQYRVLRAGTGKSPTLEDRVRVHYRGVLLDGTEFDSSYARGAPAEFGLARLIKGWQEALPLMREGAKWEIYIPAELGYGEAGAGNVIPPGAALIFEVELIAVL